MPIRALNLAGTIFLIVAALHIMRLFVEYELRIAGHDIPLWLNVAGSLVAMALAAAMFKAAALARRAERQRGTHP